MEFLVISTILLALLYLKIFMELEREMRKIKINLFRIKHQIEIANYEINIILREMTIFN